MTAEALGPLTLFKAAYAPKLPLTSADRNLLAVLIMHSRNGVCWPGLARLGACCSLSERRVRAGLRNLEAEGLLEVDSRRGRPNLYRLSLEKLAAWARRWTEPPARGAGVRSAEKAAATELTEENERGAFEALREEGQSAGCNHAATCSTPARGAAPPARGAGDPCRFASSTPARGAPKQAYEQALEQAGGKGFGEGGGFAPPACASPADLEAGARHLEEARRSLPEKFAPTLETVAAAFQKRRDLALLRKTLERLYAEAGAEVAR